MLVSLTVGKVDAGVAVLLTEDKRLIEFPSILLPPDISSGSIVDITVARNFESEEQVAQNFTTLQEEIVTTFGLQSPDPPVLRCRNATQTSVVLEWDPIQLATAELRSLSLYRNGSKAGSIPRPLEQHSTKISGLPVDTEYTFHLVLRTSAGTFGSEKLVVRTHKMTDLSGITITPGVMPAQLRESLTLTAEKIGAKIIDTVRIDTTHFVCTEGRGTQWERAQEMNVPVVVPDWVKGCEREGRLVSVRGYYLNADPRLRQVGPSVNQQQSLQSPPLQQPQASPRTEVTPPTPDQQRPAAGLPTGTSDDGKPPPTPPPKSDAERAAHDSVAASSTKHEDGEEEYTEGEESDEETLAEDAHGAQMPIREHNNPSVEDEPEAFDDVAL